MKPFPYLWYACICVLIVNVVLIMHSIRAFFWIYSEFCVNNVRFICMYLCMYIWRLSEWRILYTCICAFIVDVVLIVLGICVCFWVNTRLCTLIHTYIYVRIYSYIIEGCCCVFRSWEYVCVFEWILDDVRICVCILDFCLNDVVLIVLSICVYMSKCSVLSLA